MSRNTVGVDIIEQSDISQAPHCRHGPMLLFAKYGAALHSLERFYACSACRDNKNCCARVQFNRTITANQRLMTKYNLPHTHKEYYQRFLDCYGAAQSERKYCLTCDSLIVNDENHSKVHNQITNLTTVMMRRPSTLFVAQKNSKINAQFLFSSATTSFLLGTLTELMFTHVLCIGCPRVHEELSCRNDIHTLLLDMDHRFLQFFHESAYCRYNMFNHYFFDEASIATYKAFVRNRKLVVLVDPPFGGRVDALTTTLQKINKDWLDAGPTSNATQSVPVMWFFPYFLEPRILEHNPTYKMLDYKVDYANHVSYQNGVRGRKLGSPVRIFTNIDPAAVMLPGDEGYRFCTLCQRYVYRDNKHCSICDACTSKDGGRYKHCNLCRRCVKEFRVHCDKCNQCCQNKHICGTRTKGCFICGAEDHKKNDCPEHLLQEMGNEAPGKGDTNSLVQYYTENHVNITRNMLKGFKSKKRKKLNQRLATEKTLVYDKDIFMIKPSATLVNREPVPLNTVKKEPSDEVSLPGATVDDTQNSNLPFSEVKSEAFDGLAGASSVPVQATFKEEQDIPRVKSELNYDADYDFDSDFVPDIALTSASNFKGVISTKGLSKQKRKSPAAKLLSSKGSKKQYQKSNTRKSKKNKLNDLIILDDSPSTRITRAKSKCVKTEPFQNDLILVSPKKRFNFDYDTKIPKKENIYSAGMCMDDPIVINDSFSPLVASSQKRKRNVKGKISYNSAEDDSLFIVDSMSSRKPKSLKKTLPKFESDDDASQLFLGHEPPKLPKTRFKHPKRELLDNFDESIGKVGVNYLTDSIPNSVKVEENENAFCVELKCNSDLDVATIHAKTHYKVCNFAD